MKKAWNIVYLLHKLKYLQIKQKYILYKNTKRKIHIKYIGVVTTGVWEMEIEKDETNK